MTGHYHDIAGKYDFCDDTRCPRAPKRPDTRNHRMTPGEFERFVTEYDPLAELPGAVRNVIRTVHANPGHRINLGYGGVTLDFDGFYWVRTSRPVTWM